MRIAIAGSLLSTVLLACIPSLAEACSCVQPQSPCAAQASGTPVFVGTPVSIAVNPTNPQELTVSFDVEDSLVGTTPATVQVTTPTDTGMCGYPFAIGTKYVVYGDNNGGRMTTSLCTRTGPLASRAEDIASIRDSAAGRARPVLQGDVVLWLLALDGFLMHGGVAGGISGVPVTIEGNGERREVTSDERGHFRVADLPPGNYQARLALPPPFVKMFERPDRVELGGCIAELPIIATVVPLSGTLLTADGSPAPKNVMLRIAQLDAANQVSFSRSSLAFTDDRGHWEMRGLMPGRYVVALNAYETPTATTPYPTLWLPNATTPSGARVFDVDPNKPQTAEFKLPAALAPATISGRVIDAQGNGRGGMTVTLLDDDDRQAGGSGPSPVAYATTNDDGAFTLAGVASRRYHVGVEARRVGQTPFIPVAVPLDAKTPVVIVVP